METTGRTGGEGWLPLLVRAEDYRELADLVHQRELARGGTPAADPVGTVASAGPTGPASASLVEELERLVPWEISALEQLAGSDYETAKRWARALDVCSRHPGEILSTEQVAAESGMTVNQWRDAPRKLSRHLDRHYAGVPGWPLRDFSGRKLGLDDQVYWGISTEQARRWRTVRGT